MTQGKDTPLPSSNQKQLQRTHFKELRSKLNSAYRLQQSALVSKRLIHLLRAQSSLAIAGFYPMGAELDLRSFFYACVQYNWKLCLPCVCSSTSMEFVHIKPSSIIDLSYQNLPFIENPLARLTPQDLAKRGLRIAEAKSLDLYLCPLLAFNAQGMRLGYGGGYYDRYLESALKENPSAISCGIAFDEQLCTNLAADPHDQTLDIIMTPSKLYICSEKGKSFTSCSPN